VWCVAQRCVCTISSNNFGDLDLFDVAEEGKLSPDNVVLVERSTKKLMGMIEAGDEEIVSVMKNHRHLPTIQSQPTSVEIFMAACRAYSSSPAFGVYSEVEKAYQFMTYSQVLKAVNDLASGLTTLRAVSRGDFIAVAGFSSRDWCLADFTALYLGCPVVPLPLNVVHDDMAFMLRETEAKVVFCSLEEVDIMTGILPSCPHVATVVIMDIMDNDYPAHKDAAAVQRVRAILPSSTTVLHIEELRDCGAMSGQVVLPAIPGRDGMDANPLMGLMYTSGSSGMPKGGMLMESRWLASWKWGFRVRKA